MNQYDGSADEEDGQLSANGDNIEIDSHEEGDTADSLDIKPPQARTENRYKEKKSSKDKKHSRERKHRERDRNDELKNRHRHRGTAGQKTDSIERERYQERFSGGGGRSAERREIQPRYDQPQIRTEQHHRPADNQREYYRNNPKDRDREKMVSGGGHRERDRERRKESPDQTEADRILEDLRSRLLSKRNKITETDKTDDEYEHRRSYEYDSRGLNRYKDGKHNRENRGKEMVEVIDSPENYADLQQINHKHQSHKESRHHRPMSMEDKEQAARRAKLIDAEREMAKRKEMAREELEARRELRRERKETSTSPEQQQQQTDERKKRRNSGDREIKKKRKVEDESVVMVSDNTDENDTASDSESTSNSEDDDEEEEEVEEDEEDEEEEEDGAAGAESKDDVSEGELPVSPISVGDLSKSDRLQRSQSRSRSRSIRSISRSRSKTMSRSVSPTSRNPSRSPRSRSRSLTPKGDENDKNKVVEASPEKVEEIIEVKEELPGYYPGIQGCRSVEEFQCLNRIEEGTYGVVYRAKDKRTEEIVALKRLKMEKEKEGFPITSLREINTLLKGQHPNIVTVREIVVGSNMDKIFIVMDYVEHDLKSLMETMKHKKQVFLPGEVKCLTQQLLRAVGHLHDNWILHRDLKTSNLLLSHKGILKVGDFGLAREYGSPLKAYTSIVVTLWYRSPELLLCCKEYSTPIDMWSVGCIFAEFLSMMALFPGKSEIDQLSRIFKDLGTPNERIWPGYNELPAVQKITFAEYPVSQLRKKFSHYTSEIGLSLLQGLLTYDPKQRFTAEQALRSNFFKELPLPIDPAMFPTWPAKSELGARKALASSPKPPSGGGQFKQLENDDEERGSGAATAAWMREMSSGPGFSLKF